jgi:hypothetical protein
MSAAWRLETSVRVINPPKQVAKHRVPGLDRAADRGQLLPGSAGMGLNGHGQVGVVPPVAGVEVVEDDQRLGIGVGQLAVAAAGGRLGIGGQGGEERDQQRSNDDDGDPSTTNTSDTSRTVLLPAVVLTFHA